MRKLIMFLAALVVICSYMQGAVAEGRKTQKEFGNGAYGANRRVGTNTEYIGVSGSFSEPDAHVPDPNTSHSKPTFYLGCHSGNATAEGGIQYEDAGDGFDAGWSAFLRTTKTVKTVVSKWTSPAPNGSAWRVAIGGLGNTSLTMKVLLNGGIILSVGGANSFSFYANHDNNGATPAPLFPQYSSGTHSGQITNDALQGMSMRRVIGITQQGNSGDPFDWDGSYSHGNEFTGGDIASVSWENGYPKLTNQQLDYDWKGSWTSVDQDATGYYPGGKDGEGNWIIDFSFAGMGSKDSGGIYRDAEVTARYSAETVDINLKRAAHIKGEQR